MVKLCLNMIVKNESKIIERMLLKCIDIIDLACIVDTGSTDNTKEIITNFFKEHNKPLYIFDSDFKHFRYARQVGIDYAKSLKDEFDYMLFLDADMNLVVLPEFNKNTLDKEVYLIRQDNGNLSYYNIRLIKKTVDIKLRCVTHEYYDTANVTKHHTLETLYIADIGDGGCKETKFQRDINLFEKAIAEKDYHDEGELRRMYFYLGNSLLSIGKDKEAIESYQKRIDLGGWDEERYMSCYFTGGIYLKLKDIPNAIKSYLTGHQHSPKRVECLFKLIEIYRSQRNFNVVEMFLREIENILKNPLPDHQILFKDNNYFNFGLDYERTFLYSSSNNKSEALICSDRILFNKKAPNYMKYLIRTNMKFNAIKIYNLVNNKFHLNKVLDITKFPYHHVSNPSVTIFKNEMITNLRLINYILEVHEGSHYYILNRDGYNPINYNTKLENEQALLIGSDFLQFYDTKKQENRQIYKSPIIGIEDVRIIDFKNKLYGIGTTQEYTEKNNNQMVLFSYSEFNEMENPILLSIDDEKDKSVQKNWAPFVYKDKLLFVYSFDPFIILEPNLETGKCTKFEFENDNSDDLDLRDFRGSSQGFWYQNRLYFVIHQVYMENKTRIYLHRLISFDENLKNLKIGKPFYFETPQIEYVCGACIKNEKIIMSYSIKDRQSFLIELNLNDFLDQCTNNFVII